MNKAYLVTLILLLALLSSGLIAQNVGIGTTAPDELLNIEGGNIKLLNSSRPWVIFDHAAGTLGGGLQWWLDGAIEMEFFYDDVNQDLRFWDSQASVPRLILQRTGNLGIGAIPTSALEVNGELELGSGLYSSIKSRNDESQFRLFSSLTPFKGAYIMANAANHFDSPGSLFFTHGDATAPAPPSFIHFRYANNGVITTQLALTDMGNIGIGTSTPDKKLVVNGGARIDDSTFVVDASTHNLGIGTNLPDERLQVEGGNIKLINPARPWVIFDHAAGTLGGGLQWLLDGAIEMEFFYDDVNQDLRFWDSQAGVPRLILQRTGNLGIGAIPTSALEVNGDLELGTGSHCTIKARNDESQLRLNSSNTPLKGAFIFANAANYTDSPGSIYFYHGDFTAPAPPSSIRFVYVNDGALSTQVVLSHSGNVGIGSVLPTEKLHVFGQARFEAVGGNQIIIDGTSGLCEVEFQNNGVFGAGIGYDLTQERIYLYQGGNVFIKNGNLGIGVAPTNKIDVAGGAYCTGTSWANASSIHLKENVRPIDYEEMLGKLKQIPISEWNYISDGHVIRHVGPMAEDFYAVFGLGGDQEAISTVDALGISLAAIKALQAQNERLRSENSEMRDMISQLAARVERLEQAK